MRAGPASPQPDVAACDPPRALAAEHPRCGAGPHDAAGSPHKALLTLLRQTCALQVVHDLLRPAGALDLEPMQAALLLTPAALAAAVLFWTACLLSSCLAGASRGEDTAYLARETVRFSRSFVPLTVGRAGRPGCSGPRLSRCAPQMAQYYEQISCIRSGDAWAAGVSCGGFPQFQTSSRRHAL